MSSQSSHDFIYKVNWAGKKLEDLNKAVLAWFDGNEHFSHNVEPDPDNSGQFLLKVSADEIPIAPCSLVIGDIVQNLRSALDHLVYELAAAHTNLLTDKEERDSQFPIIGDESLKGDTGNGPVVWKKNALPRQLKCISPSAQSIIEGLQPYQLGTSFRNHPLWRLVELSNIDKHRMLHVSAAYAASYAVRGCHVTGVFTNEPGIVAKNTVVARLGITQPLDSDKSVNDCVTPNMAIAFSDGSLKGKNVIEILSEILNYIGSKVVKDLLPLLQGSETGRIV